jgi:hypothetical protein
VSLYDFTVSLTPICRVREWSQSGPASIHLHYVRKDAIRSWDDKTKAKTLCGKTPTSGSWRFVQSGTPCQACHAQASKCVVHPAPLLSKPLYKPRPPGSPPDHDPGRLMESKYDGQCQACKKFYDIGAQIWIRKGPDDRWQKRHMACGSFPPPLASPAPNDSTIAPPPSHLHQPGATNHGSQR